MKAAQWIDRAKVENGWTSDYRAAKELGIRPNTVSMYRTRGGTLDDAAALKLASVLRIDPAQVLMDQVAERMKNEEARAALLAASARLYIMLSAVSSVFVARKPHRAHLRAA